MVLFYSVVSLYLKLQNAFSCSLPMSHLTDNSTGNYVRKLLSIKCGGATYDRVYREGAVVLFHL